MSKLLIAHRAAQSSDAFMLWMKQLENDFSLWLIGEPGTLKTRKDSIHFHINSRSPKETGTIELTWDPKMPGVIEVKMNDNRRGNWAEKAHKQLLGYMND